MKILYLAPDPGVSYFQTGGAGTHIRGTVDELRKNNDVFLFIGGDFTGKFSAHHKPIDKKTSVVSKLKKSVPNFIRQINNDITRWQINKRMWLQLLGFIEKNPKPDVIYERSGYGYDLGMKLSKYLNVPYVIESDIYICDFHKHVSNFIFSEFIYRKLEKSKLEAADRIVVMSRPSINLLKDYWGIDSAKGRYKGLGIDFDENNVAYNYNISSIDNKYQLKDKFVVGFTGIFQPYHQIDLLIDVAEKLSKENISFLVVGKDPTGTDYVEIVKKRGLTNIIFTGLIDRKEIDAYYQRFDMGIIPGCAEFMYPVKFLEFYKYNRGTIVPKYDCFREFFTDDKDFDFYTFEEKSVESMVNTIKRVYDADNQETTANVKNYIINNNTWSACSERLEATLNEVVGNL